MTGFCMICFCNCFSCLFIKEKWYKTTVRFLLMLFCMGKELFFKIYIVLSIINFLIFIVSILPLFTVSKIVFLLFCLMFQVSAFPCFLLFTPVICTSAIVMPPPAPPPPPLPYPTPPFAKENHWRYTYAFWMDEVWNNLSDVKLRLPFMYYFIHYTFRIWGLFKKK